MQTQSEKLIIIYLGILGLFIGGIRAQPPEKYLNKYRGPVMQVIEVDSSRDFKKIETFDKKGNLIKREETTLNGEITYVITHTYDSLGYLISKITNDPRHNFYEEDVATYNKKGQLILLISYDNHHRETSSSVFRYDSKGNLILKYDKKNPSIKYVGKYDKEGNLIVEKEFQGRLYRIRKYRYDEKGREIEKCGYNANGKLVGKNTWMYDESGNLLEWTSFVNDKFRKVIYTWEDLTVKEVEYEDEEIKLVTYKYWIRDEYKNIIRECFGENNTTPCAYYSITYY